VKKTIIAILVTIPLALGGSAALAAGPVKDKTACVAAKATHASAKAAHVASKSATTKVARKAASAAVVVACPGK
jgi:hypothetical protein